MRRVVLLAALLALLPLPARAAEELVRWDQDGDFASALVRAKKAKKLVFVDFYATWCGPCKMMDRSVYTDSTAAREAARYVSRKVDAEKGEGIELARRYRIEAYPTLLVVDAGGTEMAREVGYRPADRFRMFLEDTRTGRGTIDGIKKLLAAKGGETFENRIALGLKLVEAGQPQAAKDEYERALGLAPADPGGRAADLLLRIARARGDADAVNAIADANAFASRFPDSPRRSELLDVQANAYAAAGQPDSAAAAAKALLALNGADNASALAAFAKFCANRRVALDDALAAATKSVDITKGADASMLDVLAEVYAARGQFDDAVSTSERAVALSPNQGYYQGQYERFQEMAVAAVRAKNR